MDSSSTSYDGMVPRINVLWGQLKGVLTGSPDAETVTALDRCACLSATSAHVDFMLFGR
jgi:hypothetical protein